MKRFLNSSKVINGFYLLVHGCFLFSFLLVQGCNNAKPVSIDASSSAIGALLSDGDFGIFGNLGAGGTSSAATSPINVSLSGYVNVTANDLSLTLTDSTDSTTQPLALTADGSYSFSTELTSGDSYSISLDSYTQGQSCSISANASGTAGTTGTATIVCERQLAIAAGWKTSSGTPVLKLFGVNHSASPYIVTKNLSVTVGGSPGSVDPELVWNGTNYLLIWKSADTTIKGQFYNISLTAVGSTFTIYTGAGVTIGKVSAAYSPSGEFAIVWTEAASTRAAKYQRINSSTGALIGTPTTIASSTSNTYTSADVTLSGSTYYTAFRQRTSGGVNSLLAYSFSTGAATSVKTYTATSGTDSLALDYPSLLTQGSNIWLFYSQTGTDGSGNVNDSTLKSSKNFQTTPATMRTETNPYGCDPVNSSGDQYMVPSATIANSTNLLVSYDLFCADMGIYNEVSNLPVTISSGAVGTPTDYSVTELGTSRTMGSSLACRTTACFISVGDESSDAIYLFDPDFGGNIGGTSTIYPNDGNGIESPITVIK
ncbi:hypothetical protein [Leptospira andrefontaineae]|uniref:Uncharacterized protein n=1 Tax=Leptospira andrefontaineae TaxID=2484976 RepID=A0A4R9H4D9_9LEPT|nr:hypothetical protein [Leptospira andrefontaineae]TGK39725.1 hypothetical protein EHO65_11005 [Leptospira andrefontaineae]